LLGFSFSNDVTVLANEVFYAISGFLTSVCLLIRVQANCWILIPQSIRGRIGNKNKSRLQSTLLEADRHLLLAQHDVIQRKIACYWMILCFTVSIMDITVLAQPK
jgi:hypothetical protein